MTSFLSQARFPAGSRSRRLLWRAGFTVAAVVALGAVARDYLQQAHQHWLVKAPTADLVAVAKARPDNTELQHAAAFRLRSEGRPREALPLAARAVELVPSEPPYRLLLGYLLVGTRRPAEGLREFERTLETDPGSAKAHEAAGLIYLPGRWRDQAVEHLDRAYSPARPNPTMALARVAARYHRGDYVEAERLAREALQHSPWNAIDVHRWLACILLAQGKGTQAEEELEGHLRRYRYHLPAGFHSELARTILERSPGTDRLSAAESWARRGVRRDRDRADGEVPRVMGLVLQRQGRHAEAVPYLERAASLSPKVPQVRRELARSLRAVGRTTEAAKVEPPRLSAPGRMTIARLRAHLAAQPGDGPARLELALSLEGTGDLVGALHACWPLLDSDRAPPEAVQLANRTLQSLMDRPEHD